MWQWLYSKHRKKIYCEDNIRLLFNKIKVCQIIAADIICQFLSIHCIIVYGGGTRRGTMWHLGHGQQTGTKTYEHCYTVDRLHTDRCDTFTPSSILVLILPISHLILMGNSPPLPSHLFPVVFLQGSTLGPILFSMYVAPLERLVDECGAQCHQYADDVISMCHQYVTSVCDISMWHQYVSRCHQYADDTQLYFFYIFNSSNKW